MATHKQHSDVFIPLPESEPALDAFEEQISDHLEHAAFSKFGSVKINATEVRRWADDWALKNPTEAEKRVMANLLQGTKAPEVRRKGYSLMLSAAAHIGGAQPNSVRNAINWRSLELCADGGTSKVIGSLAACPGAELFRLSLEFLLFWILNQLSDGPKSSEALVDAFAAASNIDKTRPASEWLSRPDIVVLSPAALLEEIQAEVQSGVFANFPSAIASGLAFSIAEGPEKPETFERQDRLPLARARKEALAWTAVPTSDFLKHVFELWVLAQHLYWAVGRGLADARSGGKRILRVRVVLDEQGWAFAPGASANQPAPSEDRLRTALSLATECDLL